MGLTGGGRVPRDGEVEGTFQAEGPAHVKARV